MACTVLSPPCRRLVITGLRSDFVVLEDWRVHFDHSHCAVAIEIFVLQHTSGLWRVAGEVPGGLQGRALRHGRLVEAVGEGSGVDVVEEEDTAVDDHIAQNAADDAVGNGVGEGLQEGRERGG